MTADNKYIVGKRYKILCALVKHKGRIKSVPVLGSAHKDVDLNNFPKHYHIDGRFTPGRGGMFDTNINGYTNNAIAVEDPTGMFNAFVGTAYRYRTCKRLTTGVLPPKIGFFGEATRYATWYSKFVGLPCKGKKCPHLGTEMLECDGRLVCPLHGLEGDLQNEVIIDFKTS